MASGDGLLFAKADGVNAFRRNSQIHEILPQSQRAAISQGEIVSLGATFIAVTFDQQKLARIRFVIVGDHIKLRLLGFLDGGTVQIEMHRLGGKFFAILVGRIVEINVRPTVGQCATVRLVTVIGWRKLSSNIRIAWAGVSNIRPVSRNRRDSHWLGFASGKSEGYGQTQR